MMKFEGREAGRRWRLLDLPGISKSEEAWDCGGCVMAAYATGERAIAMYTRDEWPRHDSNEELEIVQSLEFYCPIVAASVDALCVAEDAAREAREALAATLRDPDAAEWQRERAQEAGMAWGCDAYNDHMGF